MQRGEHVGDGVARVSGAHGGVHELEDLVLQVDGDILVAAEARSRALAHGLRGLEHVEVEQMEDLRDLVVVERGVEIARDLACPVGDLDLEHAHDVEDHAEGGCELVFREQQHERAELQQRLVVTFQHTGVGRDGQVESLECGPEPLAVGLQHGPVVVAERVPVLAQLGERARERRAVGARQLLDQIDKTQRREVFVEFRGAVGEVLAVRQQEQDAPQRLLPLQLQQWLAQPALHVCRQRVGVRERQLAQLALLQQRVGDGERELVRLLAIRARSELVVEPT